MCYIPPTVAGIVTTFVWKSKKKLQLFWLTLMFYGGALFGIIDHLWHDELFLVSENWMRDVLLGIVITIAIILAWGCVLMIAKRIPTLNTYLRTVK